MTRIASILFSLGVLILSACGSDDATDSATPLAAAETDDAETNSEAQADSDVEPSDGDGGTVDVPADFAIPTVDGAVVVIDSLPGIPDGAYLQLLYPGDRYDELVQFYEVWIGEQTAEWSPTPPDTSNGAVWFSLALEGEPGYGQSVTIAPPSDSDGRAAVALVAESADS